MDLFKFAALALFVLPLIKMLSDSLSNTGTSEPSGRDIWAKPVPAWLFYAKLLAMIALGSILMVSWAYLMIEIFTPTM
ncbi:hypothetical protein [Escherichia coli]|uniref:hypothetical protein n=1 Tax=Escherichia coli TaxID=562 RepID=UPI000BE293DD|nr:hypothetical protein [Escherichia coli]